MERTTLIISAVIPVYNEIDNIEELLARLHSVLSQLDYDFEILIVDDGSTDETSRRLEDLRPQFPELKPIILARNYGQSTAMQAGIDAAVGDIIVTLDGDLQNDPNDIPQLLEVLETENVDLVSGWRRDRHDSWLRVKLSQIANTIISKTTKVHLHDYGCSLKVYRSDLLRELKIYGELHRFIPALMAEIGAEIREVVVKHHPRLRGKSKYGSGRVVRVTLDILLIMFMRRYIQRPLHFFGGIGLLFGTVGLAITMYLSYLKIFHGEALADRPLLLLGVTFLIFSVVMIVQGLIGELITRLLLQTSDQPQYRIRRPPKRCKPLSKSEETLGESATGGSSTEPRKPNSVGSHDSDPTA